MPERFLEVRLHAFDALPEKIQLDGKTLNKISPTDESSEGYFYEEQSGILTIRFLDTGKDQTLKIK
jgi:hypothetical protein